MYRFARCILIVCLSYVHVYCYRNASIPAHRLVRENRRDHDLRHNKHRKGKSFATVGAEEGGLLSDCDH